MHSQPASNDVIVRPTRVQREVVYVLRTAAGPDQLLMRDREAAVVHALAFARFAHLDAWFDDRAAGLVLLGSFREAGEVEAGSAAGPRRLPSRRAMTTTA